MNIVETSSEELARPHGTLALRVRYLASPRPYVEPRAPLTETLAILKPKVLHFFGLAEGEVEGGRKEYAFSAHGVIQSNPAETLGHLAQGKHELELKLLEQFIQG
ncbi:MAG: hypothetical protein RJA36_32 [Pseudomonadota bacterium]|jgi:hypothetical protein